MKLTLMMAVTVDGKIARHGSHFPDWTGKADKRMFKQFTEQAGVIIMGSKTFATLENPLPNRLNVVMTRQPTDYSTNANLLFTDAPPQVLLAEIAARGYQTAVLAGGAHINSLFLRHRLIDEMILTVAPLVFGQGVSLFAEETAVRLELISSSPLEENFLMLHYRCVYE